MALNEITKGMSNAAEMINNNFNFGSIVESGSGENGNYIKFVNGFTVCWREIEINRVGPPGEQGIEKPVIFSGPIFGGISTSSGSYLDGDDMNLLWVAKYVEAWRWGRRSNTNWSGSGKFKAVLWAAGMIAE